MQPKLAMRNRAGKSYRREDRKASDCRVVCLPVAGGDIDDRWALDFVDELVQRCGQLRSERQLCGCFPGTPEKLETSVVFSCARKRSRVALELERLDSG